jgi:hypothetical protein
MPDADQSEHLKKKQRVPHAKSVFIWNVLTFFLIGSLVCLWAQYYTDRLPEIASLLGGGGALVWLTAGIGVLKSSRADEVREWFDASVMGSRVFSLFLMLCVVVLALAATQYGSVQIQSVVEEPDHSVQVRPLGTTSADWEHLAPADSVRQLVRTTWFQSAKAVVKVKGYPEKVVVVEPFRRVLVYVPNSVRTPVILLRPRIPVIDAARPRSPKDPVLMSLEIATVDGTGKPFRETIDFDGHPVLMGTDGDIPIPPELEEQWQAEAVRADNRQDALEIWRTPEAPEQLAIALAPKQEVTVTLKLKRDQSNYAPPQQFIVKPVRSLRSFVQEVVIQGP